MSTSEIDINNSKEAKEKLVNEENNNTFTPDDAEIVPSLDNPEGDKKVF